MIDYQTLFKNVCQKCNAIMILFGHFFFFLSNCAAFQVHENVQAEGR